ncbi:receptor-interacting serine/threonine-protein kinase 2-like isoform 2-T2 [Rhinophrynus dorsalis]
MSDCVPVVTPASLKTFQIVETSSRLVYKAPYGPTGSYVFMKLLNLSDLNERALEEILEDVENIRQIRSERLMKTVAVYRSPSMFGILTDWMQNGSLHSLIYQPKLYPELPLCVCVQILVDVAEGLNHLHSLTPPILHEALKPSNILLDAQYRAKISDFGQSRLRTLLPVPSDSDENCRVYLSPERLMGEVPTKADDSYSLGIIGWEIFSRQHPFQNMNDPLKMETYITRGHRPQPDMNTFLQSTDILPAQRGDLIQFVNLCWHQKNFMRPTMAECFSHLRNILHTFPKEKITCSINSLNKQKEQAELTSKNETKELNIRFLDFSASSNSKSRQRTMSVPDERQMPRSNGSRETKEHRSVSVPNTTSGQSFQAGRPLCPTSSQRPEADPCQKRALHSTTVSWINGGSSHVPGLFRSISCTETLIRNRESILRGMTPGCFNQLLDILRSSRVISKGDYEIINAKMTLMDRVRECLDTCCGKGEEASQAILRTLASSKFSYGDWRNST